MPSSHSGEAQELTDNCSPSFIVYSAQGFCATVFSKGRGPLKLGTRAALHDNN